MANYVDNFEANGEASGAPAGWTDGRWDAGFNPSTISDGAAGITLRSSPTVSGRKLLTFDAVNSDPDTYNVEILARVRFANASSGESGLASLVLRASGDGASENGYCCGIVSRNLNIFRFSNATYTELIRESGADRVMDRTWYWIRFRANGTSLKGRLWEDGSQEPSTWDIETTDSILTSGGWAGVYSSAITTPAPRNDFSVVAVATGGDTATLIPDEAAISPLPGALRIEGFAPAVGQSAPISVSPSPGAIVAAGFAPAVSKSAEITFSRPARSTFDLPNCSVAQNGSTPTITIQCLPTGDSGQNEALVMYGRISGVAGMTPAFRLAKSGWNPAQFKSGYKFFYSHDEQTWFEFDSRTSDVSYYYFGNDAAFASDTVFVCTTRPWLPAYTLPWIQSLEATGLVDEAPSSAGSGYVFATRSATVGQLGEAIPASPLYSFRISGGSGNAPDGAPKRRAVLIAGIHAGEDIGNQQLRAAVDFLVSSDPKAAALRGWFDFFVYPLVSTAGRIGGANREDYQAGLANADVNRQWSSSTTETVNAHKTAISTDCGVPDAWFDYHGSWIYPFTYHNVTTSGAMDDWADAFRSYRPQQVVQLSTTIGTSTTYAASVGATLAVVSEYDMLLPNTADIESYAADSMRALSDLASSWYFSTGPVDHHVAAANMQAGATLSGVAIDVNSGSHPVNVSDLIAQGALTGVGIHVDDWIAPTSWETVPQQGTVWQRASARRP